MTKSIIKNFDKEIAAIEEIESWNEKKAMLEISGQESFISKSGYKFKFKFNGVFPYSEHNAITVVIEGNPYALKGVDFQKDNNNIFQDLPAEHIFDVDTMAKGDIYTSSYFRMFFFEDSEQNNIFHYKLESPKYDGVIPWTFDCVRLVVDGVRYDISRHTSKCKSYFIIENLDIVYFENFKADSYAIQKGLGFLIGYMPGGENYIFSGENFIYQRLSRKALKFLFFPVTSNPHSKIYPNNDRNIADKYVGKVKMIPSVVASTLVERIKADSEFSVAILLLMEVASLKSVVSMPGVFSVVLESFANILSEKSTEVTKVINNSRTASSLVTDLNTVLDKYTNEISPEAVTKITRRLAEVTKPVNNKRLTNAEKLRLPFDQLKIKLSTADEKAIDYRNDLLHGNILMNTEQVRSDEEIDDHMLYVSARLYTIISKLILKSCGFEGYVINHSKFYIHDVQNQEEFFELI